MNVSVNTYPNYFTRCFNHLSYCIILARNLCNYDLTFQSLYYRFGLLEIINNLIQEIVALIYPNFSSLFAYSMHKDAFYIRVFREDFPKSNFLVN